MGIHIERSRAERVVTVEVETFNILGLTRDQAEELLFVTSHIGSDGINSLDAALRSELGIHAPYGYFKGWAFTKLDRTPLDMGGSRIIRVFRP